MKIFVVGALKEPLNDERTASFNTACNNIGAWLHSKHSIIVAASLPPTADYYVIEGIKNNFDSIQGVPSSLNLRVYSATADDTQNKLKTEKPNLYKFLRDHDALKDIYPTRSYILVHLEAIKDADLIVVVGGGKDTADICALAERFGKRILALSYWGGEGKEIFNELQGDYKKRLLPNELTFLSSNLQFQTEANCEKFLEIVNKTANKTLRDYLYLHVNVYSFIFIILLCVLALLYTGFFFNAHKKDMLYIPMFVFSIIAGMVGSLIKFTFLKNDQISLYDEFGDFAKAIISGFATGISVSLTTLGMMTLVITDSTVILNHPDIINRVTLSAIILSFAAIFGVEMSNLKKLGDIFKRAMK